MVIRKAQIDDFDEIKHVYEHARQIMKESGNPNQWGDTHPPLDVLQHDIDNQCLYVVLNNEEICASFYCNNENDPTYDVIEDGKWLNDAPYYVIHRVGSNGKASGVLTEIINYVSKFAGNIRIDTHSDNRIMQHLLTKNGFIRCGIIHLANGDPRIAFQKECSTNAL